MRHIIVPLSDSLGANFDYLAAVAPQEKRNYGLVIQSEDPDPAFLQEGRENACWKYSVCMTASGAKDALAAVFEQIRSNIDPQGSDSFVVDVVIDAAHAKMAQSVLPMIRRAGQWYRVHVIFLSKRDSDYGSEQASLYTKIRSDAGGKHEDSGLGWTWFSLLSDENRNGAIGEIISGQREVLLPYLFLDDHANDSAHSCFTYATDYQLISFDKIPDIPRVQAIRYACKAIQARESYSEMGLLLMNGDSCPEDEEAQKKILKDHLLKSIDLKPITGQDLIVHKHSPQSDMSTRELLKELLSDNPDLDVRRYDRAVTEEQLMSLSFVAEGVKAWEEYLLDQMRKRTELEKIRNQLNNDSEWFRRISKGFQTGYFKDDPFQMCAATIRGKDGYGSEAVKNAENDLERINQQLREGIFQACLRLLVLQSHQTYQKADAMIREREEAVKEALASVAEWEETERMIPDWCDWIQGKLMGISQAVPLYTEEAREPRQLLTNYAQTLLDHLRGQISVEDGIAEMASTENTNALMRRIKETKTPYQLVNAALGGSASMMKEEEWYVCDRLHPTYDAEKVKAVQNQIVILITSFYLRIAGDTAPDPEKEELTETMFRNQVHVKMNVINKATNAVVRPEPEKETDRAGRNRPENPERETLRFSWEHPEADSVRIDFFLYGTTSALYTVTKDKPSFGGNFVISPPPSLPSGARIEIEIRFLRAGHEIGKYPNIIHYETAKVRYAAEEEEYPVKTGLFKKTWYHRLRIRDASGLDGKVGVRNAVSNCLCSNITWYQDGADCVSEPLPEGGAWGLANRPDSAYVFLFD